MKVQVAKDDDPGNPTINFHGEKRANDAHLSTTSQAQPAGTKAPNSFPPPPGVKVSKDLESPS